MLNTLDGDPFAFDHRLFVTFGNHEFDKRKFDQASILSTAFANPNSTGCAQTLPLPPMPKGYRLCAARI